MSVSVCIASYNGEKYIKEQVTSILSQLDNEDEVIISDDSSSDNTIQIIESIQDSRIVLLQNQTFHSHVYNFENALKHAKGEYLFLADQDDVWMPHKLETMLNLLKNYDLVLSDAIMVDEHMKELHASFFSFHHSSKGLAKNLYKNSYLGCCMGFNRYILDIALPFPKDINMHDWWIGLIGEIYGNVCFSDEKLVKYRRHEDALTPTDRKSSNSFFKKIGFRVAMIKGLFLRVFKQIWLRYTKDDRQK
jgi:glycosyltransferase involved in cell wall biosynthesis